ncbi:CGNR zinc finger domain-containing protein [Streptomyces sp. NPDC004539]|uniref:CGNR zinc finger domain-containing protein n=1 Tax=Streptomyces sp. NPDC004539 TaxID=3154280 RepID=UPI0033A564A6
MEEPRHPRPRQWRPTPLPPAASSWFDRTRNGSGLYCSTACGSQVSMRNYRRQQREETGPTPEA